MKTSPDKKERFELEAAVKEWRKSLRRDGRFEDGEAAELETHLRDEFEGLSAEGLPPAEAFRRATGLIGSAGNIGPQFFKRRARGLLILHTLKVSLRKIRKQKLHSLINIAGLGTGMACCILISLWVRDEMSYDRFHKNGNQVFRVLSEDLSGGQVTKIDGAPAPLAPALADGYPEVHAATRVQSGWGGWNLTYEDKNFSTNRLAALDPNFFEIFHFPFLLGDPRSCLSTPDSLVLTETMARKAFGSAPEAMGKVFRMNEASLKVTAVIRDIPRNSHIQFDYAFPASRMAVWRSSKFDDWTYTQFATYVELKPGTDAAAFEEKISDIVGRHVPRTKFNLRLIPLAGVHFVLKDYGDFCTSYQTPGDRSDILLFSLIAALILVTACVNFVNLATAKAEQRAKEVGIRKAAGARASDILRQFLGEALFTSFLSLLLALVLVILALPGFNRLSHKAIGWREAGQPGTWLLLLGIALLAGLVSGGYPAFLLSKFRPVQALRGLSVLGRRGGIPRKILVSLQFAFAVVLIASTAVILWQLSYVEKKDLGLDRNNIVIFASYGRFGQDFAASKAALLLNPDILSVSKGFPPMSGAQRTDDIDWEGRTTEAKPLIDIDSVDPDYLTTFGMKLDKGRFYSADTATDRDGFVLNETAVKALNLADPIGKWFRMRGDRGPILGVVKDYHTESLRVQIAPKVLRWSRDGFFIIVRYRPGSTREALAFLESKWKEYVPNRPFRHNFYDQTVQAFYEKEEKTAILFRVFAGMSILISCLGLLGLVSYVAERRTKEIGIRKVLGAGSPSIVGLIGKEFLGWLLAANLVAWPAAFVFSRKWLEGFAYRIEPGFGLYIFSSLAALIITMAAVGGQSLRAAAAKPVRSLRYE